MMLYSTCTFDPSENEEVIAHLLRERPEFHVCPIESLPGFAPGRPDLVRNGDLSLADTVRIFPHRMHGRGISWPCSKRESRYPGRK